ncbi:uncharacterized protein A4U43_C04F24320 [Asparagus officinalis]|uniref:Uncharacterized protein n=1 Tax=Asparagus officinalis TaxID=4686 RepID=A0A5P1F3A8_ASPOF|nr:uncharacterized protein A4U43_C04F24320 [Asparagus officinalis]
MTEAGKVHQRERREIDAEIERAVAFVGQVRAGRERGARPTGCVVRLGRAETGLDGAIGRTVRHKGGALRAVRRVLAAKGPSAHGLWRRGSEQGFCTGAERASSRHAARSARNGGRLSCRRTEADERLDWGAAWSGGKTVSSAEQAADEADAELRGRGALPCV